MRISFVDSPSGGQYHGGSLILIGVTTSDQCLFVEDAGVAQLVEQRFRKPQVVRSIRIAGSITPHGISGSCTFHPVLGFCVEAPFPSKPQGKAMKTDLSCP